MSTLRDQIERMSIIITDIGDYRSAEKFRPRDVVLSSAFVAAACGDASRCDARSMHCSPQAT